MSDPRLPKAMPAYPPPPEAILLDNQAHFISYLARTLCGGDFSSERKLQTVIQWVSAMPRLESVSTVGPGISEANYS